MTEIGRIKTGKIESSLATAMGVAEVSSGVVGRGGGGGGGVRGTALGIKKRWNGLSILTDVLHLHKDKGYSSMGQFF